MTENTNDNIQNSNQARKEKIAAGKKLNDQLKKNMSKISHKILVLSNKGGVGKSSVAINLACSLSEKGFKVGLLDADLHGPSVAKMLGFEGKRLQGSPEGILPMSVSPNLVAVSMASLMETSDAPLIWRGPLKMMALKQFLGEVQWGDLDYLIIDSPPGTGDEPLSICQLIPELEGGVIVTTPQSVALLDSRKCVNFLKNLKIPILGIIENMSGLKCPHCGKNIDLFKSGGGEKAAAEFNLPFLGKIPIDIDMVNSAEEGKPFIFQYKDSETAQIFNKVLKLIINQIK
ncbi:MAG: Mrp/NBP35 family ATP-binding protein [Candidatus Caldatribacteriota bacterium]|nr:Mrp/NBP35 family ATP-binding protein [Candidatus Caldatribacteriota bacterium]